MGDAKYLANLTGNVAPVTDNYPLRISSDLVYEPGRIRFMRPSWTQTNGSVASSTANSSTASGRKSCERKPCGTSLTTD